jgi:hypothetical protein
MVDEAHLGRLDALSIPPTPARARIWVADEGGGRELSASSHNAGPYLPLTI